MITKLLLIPLLISATLQTACERVPLLVEYKNNGSLGLYLESAPIIIVGQILKHVYVGHPHPSRWDPNQPMQLCKVTVRVENILRGDIGAAVVPVYYLISIRMNGPLRMGMEGHGGKWRIGDRLIFFLRQDSGVLRTVVDTWAQPTAPVLTGAHPNYKPQPNEPISDSIIDILLNRGQGCDDKQMALAISTSHAYFFDLAYAVRKLRQIALRETPLVREAAKKELEDLSYSWPKIRTGWPEKP
jgi:hypothetical protein